MRNLLEGDLFEFSNNDRYMVDEVHPGGVYIVERVGKRELPSCFYHRYLEQENVKLLDHLKEEEEPKQTIEKGQYWKSKGGAKIYIKDVYSGLIVYVYSESNKQSVFKMCIEDFLNECVPWIEEEEEEPSALNTQIAGNHYSNGGIQPIEYIHANKLGFIEGNVVKYITRHREKNGIEDLEKIKHYIDLLIELEYKNK